MYKLYKYIPVVDDMAYNWDEVCVSQNINYISQLAEGMCRVDGRGRYRYNIDQLTFEVMRLGNGKYKHVKIN
ncbi:hypothetical protein BRE01_62660 [Brevibacillus reuszeri]|uniref:Uncharacterized protein n=1 Tax=Brevibacillus reuszeri TaxID=54915 RepID=A0A0K9YWA3_9BACL|nr:hypothetical protein ADS79_14095 [Brevibacillus reuszeri]GED72564.1 hypothetical protein BRE01_62660 [Brevibacillus reuszeri]